MSVFITPDGLGWVIVTQLPMLLALHCYLKLERTSINIFLYQSISV